MIDLLLDPQHKGDRALNFAKFVVQKLFSADNDQLNQIKRKLRLLNQRHTSTANIKD